MFLPTPHEQPARGQIQLVADIVLTCFHEDMLFYNLQLATYFQLTTRPIISGAMAAATGRVPGPQRRELINRSMKEQLSLLFPNYFRNQPRQRESTTKFSTALNVLNRSWRASMSAMLSNYASSINKGVATPVPWGAAPDEVSIR